MEDCNCYNQSEKDYSKPSFSVLLENLSSALVTVYGNMFDYKTLNGLYLSSSNTNIDTLTTLDLYSNVKSISGRYPPVTVFSVEKYDILENYILQFKLPENLLVGNYDILYFNDAGYFKASKSKRFTYFTVISSISSNGIPTSTPSTSNNITPTPTPTTSNNITPTSTPTNTFTPTPSPTIPEAASIVFTVESFTDNDNDGYSNTIEQLSGTDPNDPNDFPISIFNVFNNI